MSSLGINVARGRIALSAANPAESYNLSLDFPSMDGNVTRIKESAG
jgi:hypothetical protein